MSLFRRELAPMLRIATPLVLAELGWMSMGLVDTIMVGHLPHAAVPLSAAALAQILYNTLAFGLAGILLGLDTMIAQAHGAGAATHDFRAANRWFLQGVLLALALAALLHLLILLAPLGMRHLPIEAPILDRAIPTLHALSWGTIPLLLSFAMRRHLQAFGHGRLIVANMVFGNLVNILLDWLFIFPHGTHPGLGVVGSGYATSIARLATCVFAFSNIVTVNRRHRYGLLAPGLLPSVRPTPVRFTSGRRTSGRRTSGRLIDLRPHAPSLRRLIALGLPSGATLFVEILIFATVTAILGTLGPVPLAGHEIALNCISFTFMVPLGLSAAASVRVGQAIGRREPRQAKAAGWAAIALGAAFMLLSSATYLLLPTRIARAFTQDPAVLAATVPLLLIAALFQFCDGLQVTAIGALRGAGDTRTGFLTHLCSYWLLGLPLGLYLCFHRHLGARGLWLGLSAALTVSGLVLITRWQAKTIHLAQLKPPIS